MRDEYKTQTLVALKSLRGKELCIEFVTMRELKQFLDGLENNIA